MNAIVKTFKNGNTVSTIEQSRIISRTLGIRTASRYLAKRGYSVEMAVYILLGV